MVEALLAYKVDTSVPDPQGRSIKNLLTLYNDERLNTIFASYEKN